MNHRNSAKANMERYNQLLQMLNDTNEDVVIEAAHTLGDLGYRNAVPVLLHLLTTAPTSAIRNAAAIGLRELGDPVAIPVLLDLIRDLYTTNQSGTLIYALETLNAKDGVIDLAFVMCRGDYEAVAMALRVIAAFEGPLPLEQTRKALDILQECSLNVDQEEWREEMIIEAIDLLLVSDES